MTIGGLHCGDHCRTLISRCSDGVPGGSQDGNTGDYSPLAGGKQPTADSRWDGTVAGDRAQVPVGGERVGNCPGRTGCQRRAVEPSGGDQPVGTAAGGNAGAGPAGAVGRSDLPVAHRRPVVGDAHSRVAAGAWVCGVVHVVAPVHPEAKLGAAQCSHRADAPTGPDLQQSVEKIRRFIDCGWDLLCCCEGSEPVRERGIGLEARFAAVTGVDQCFQGAWTHLSQERHVGVQVQQLSSRLDLLGDVPANDSDHHGRCTLSQVPGKLRCNIRQPDTSPPSGT